MDIYLPDVIMQFGDITNLQSELPESCVVDTAISINALKLHHTCSPYEAVYRCQEREPVTRFPEMRILWQVYSILLLNIVKESTACSDFCVCKWKNGKQTVECGGKNLSEIPNGMDPETQVLEFSGNKLNKLSKELFLKKQLINLQRVYVSSCKIKSVHRDTFKGLTNLVELDLSDNLLESIPSGAFMNCPSLMKLTLNLNPINSLKKFAFNHLSYLNTLELSNCQISEIEEGAFQGLHSLEWLRLDGNKLKTIRGRRTLPENAKGVDLQKNGWECDCHIQDLSAWLRDFNIRLSEEPVCQGPHGSQAAQSDRYPCRSWLVFPTYRPLPFIWSWERARTCLFCVTCTPFPKPQSRGQMLQNNTMVAPGLHLIYFVEEGSENKRSELFIYNANADDNGTFICNADNAAGTSQSNFTIKIILKEDPIVIIVSFPLEYFVYAVIGISIAGIIVVIVITVLIVKCHRRSSRQRKREQMKEVAMQFQQNANKQEENVECLPETLKINTPSTNYDEDIMVGYGVHPCNELLTITSPTRVSNQARSPTSLRRYQLEQNPDLINGTESIGCRREGDGEDENQKVLQGESVGVVGAVVANAIPIACLRGSAEFYTDMRCIVDSDGYPIDYGLPKIPCRTQCSSSDSYYRTLPTNRMKRYSAANPLKRYSREAEFLSRSVDSPYDYQTDVRYTADGYPARMPVSQQQPTAMDAFAQTSGAPTSLPCCSLQWPACVPANLHVINPGANYPQPKCVTKKCASAQTDTESDTDNPEINTDKGESAVRVENDAVNEMLTESPDEGYEGEPSVV
ncbi:hypothetical protein NQ315_011212 [Exocentrus adspersus]|uniref:LRRCT domain-containing protein n=1 Tax=Exocentrus adspersus TaxID=1586481 RepID=A0AAV8VFG7_9CUCU|nr:hypothetical protein NQ315_011212 [Exocentrus adspersus]